MSYLEMHTGKSFPRPIRMIGYICMLIGLFSISESVIIGILVVSLGAYLSFNISGFEINEGKYRHFTYFIFFRLGKWKKTEFHKITILKKILAQRTHSRANLTITNKGTYYEITLLSDSHRKKERLIRVDEKDKARQLTDKISKLLDLEITDYKPSSRRRR